jgi:hypothetical protein
MKYTHEDPVTARAKNIRFHDSLNQRPWKPVTTYEILIYLGILIYMGIHVEPVIDDYWNTNEDDPIHQSSQDSQDSQDNINYCMQARDLSSRPA